MATQTVAAPSTVVATRITIAAPSTAAAITITTAAVPTATPEPDGKGRQHGHRNAAATGGRRGMTAILMPCGW